MPGSAVIATLIEVSQDISLFQAYFVYLENAIKKKANTMRIISQVSVMCNDIFCYARRSHIRTSLYCYIKDLRKTIGWLCMQAKVSFDALKTYLHQIESTLKTRATIAQRSNTLNNQIADKKIAEGGLEEVEEAVKAAYERAKLVDVKGLDRHGQEKLYNYVKMILRTALYVYVPQGRDSAPTNLLYEQRTELLSKLGAAFTDKFKTSAHYGYQPVLMNSILQEMLQTFLTRWRPILKNIMPKELLLDEKGMLFPKYGPTMLVDTSDPVSAFTLKELGICMSATKFRDLWEIRAEYMQNTQQITPQQRNAVSGVSTHSGINSSLIFMHFCSS